MIIVTGASGFIGKALCKELFLRNRPFIGAVRKLNFNNNSIFYKNFFEIGDINKETQWIDRLGDIKTIIHTASAPQFLRNDMTSNQFRELNLKGIKNLMEQAVASGVQKFIFISTIRVNGQQTIYSKDNASGKEQNTKFQHKR